MYNQVLSFVAALLIGISLLILSISHVFTWHKEFEQMISKDKLYNNEHVLQMDKEKRSLDGSSSYKRLIVTQSAKHIKNKKNIVIPVLREQNKGDAQQSNIVMFINQKTQFIEEHNHVMDMLVGNQINEVKILQDDKHKTYIEVLND